MSHGINHLEGMLRVWEDSCYLLDLLNRGFAATLPSYAPFRSRLKTGATANFGSFRRHLLESLDAGYDAVKYGRYLLPQPDSFPDLKNLARIPPALYGWSKHSRRIFDLSEDTQLILTCTDNQGMTWKDVDWPFNHFVIRFPLTIRRNDGLGFGAAMVSVVRNDRDRFATITLLPKALRKYVGLGLLAKSGLDGLLHAGKFEDLKRRIAEIFKGMGKYATFDQVTLDLDDLADRRAFAPVSGTFTETQIRSDEGLEIGHIDAISRLVAGFCLYLTALPASQRPGGISRQRNRKKDGSGRCIDDVAKVCHVESVHRLSQQERDIFRLARRIGGPAVSAHFRRGHWRRAPGTADDPDAPKIVHVRPTIVRRDRLGPGELPGGSETKVL